METNLGDIEAQAARYRWMRDVAWDQGLLVLLDQRYGPEDWDRWIDEQMRATGPANPPTPTSP